MIFIFSPDLNKDIFLENSFDFIFGKQDIMRSINLKPLLLY